MNKLLNKHNSSRAGIAILLYTAAMLVVQIGMLTAGMTLETDLWLWIYMSSSPILLVCISMAITYDTDYSIFGDKNFRTVPDGIQILQIFGFSFGSIYLAQPVLLLLETGLKAIGYDVSAGVTPDMSTPIGLLLGILIVGLVVPFGEEVMLRGVVLRGLKPTGYVKAIIWTGLVFGLMHGSIMQFVHQVAIGIIAAYLVIVSRSIWSGMLMHMFNNLIVVVVTYMQSTLQSGTTEIPEVDILTTLLYAVIGGTVAVLCLIGFTKRAIERKKASSPEARRTYNTLEGHRGLRYIEKLCEYVECDDYDVKNTCDDIVFDEFEKATIYAEPILRVTDKKEKLFTAGFVVCIAVLGALWIMDLVMGIIG